jgi:hypothetical protein
MGRGQCHDRCRHHVLRLAPSAAHVKLAQQALAPCPPSPSLWSGWLPGAGCGHADFVGALTPAETLIAARRLAGVKPHVGAVAGIAHRDDLWRLCRKELTGVDVCVDGWDIRGRWFGAVVVATPRTGVLPRGETIPWRVVAAHLAPRERRPRDLG